LTPQNVQPFFNQELASGKSARYVQMMREVLSSALTQAMREDLVMRNVARLVTLPTAERPDIKPWKADEALRFLEVSADDPLHAAFVILVYYGLRKGEVLGLRWQDIDYEESLLKINQQLQSVGGKLFTGPVKTSAGKRELPLLEVVGMALEGRRRAQIEQQRVAGDFWQGDDTVSGLIFTTSSGLPIEPRNFNRSFHRICAQHGIRRIRVHDVRHTLATLLMNLRVPARQAQLILGHANISTTQLIYQHGDMENRAMAMKQVEGVLNRSGRPGSQLGFLDRYLRSPREATDRDRCCQQLLSTSRILQQKSQLHLEPMAGPKSASHQLQNTRGGGTPSTLQCITDVAHALRVTWRHWLVGFVVVKTVVKTR
jgi:integrase